MSTPTTSARRRQVRRTAGVVGAGAVAVTAAVAIPALAQGNDDAEPAPATEAVAATVTSIAGAELASVETPLTPEEQARQTLENASPEQRAAFVLYVMTPEQRTAFQLFTSTPEQRAAFEQFVNPPPPPPPPAPAPVRQQQASTAGNQSQAPKAAANSGGGGGSGNGFLDCVRNRESRGQYGAVNGGSGAAGAYQFMPQTWNNTARHAGRSDLVGKNPAAASRADQDAMARALYQWQGSAPWGGGC